VSNEIKVELKPTSAAQIIASMLPSEVRSKLLWPLCAAYQARITDLESQLAEATKRAEVPTVPAVGSKWLWKSDDEEIVINVIGCKVHFLYENGHAGDISAEFFAANFEPIPDAPAEEAGA
jgi:hypothetical protein